MALVQCKECKAEVSTKAKACPKCGAAVPKRTSVVTWLIAGLFGAAMIGAISNSSRTGSSASAAAPLSAASAAEKAAHDATNATAVAGAQMLKRAMKDPDSFELKQLLVMRDGTACYTYRATNSFNAKLQSSALLIPGKSPKMLMQSSDGNQFVDAWNKRCTKTGEDLSTYANMSLT